MSQIKDQDNNILTLISSYEDQFITNNFIVDSINPFDG